MAGRGDNNKHSPGGHGSSKQGNQTTGKRDKNAGGSAFNPNNEANKLSREKEDPKSGNIGKNNAGGFEHMKK
jgi:hypothetical protein